MGRERTALGALAALAALAAGCGGASAPAPEAARDSGASGHMPPASRAHLVLHMTRVQGDDPLPFAIDLRADGSAKVRFGGGHGGFEDKRIQVRGPARTELLRLVRTAPWRQVDGRTVTPGGFGGDDNGVRYAIYHGRYSTVLASGHVPARMRRLVHRLDQVIDGDLGHLVYAKRHSPIPVTPAPAG
jgi:hypothetical protein